MIIPIRCLACGKPVAQLYEEFKERSEKGEDKGRVMTELGLKRFCCRALFLGHVDLINTVAEFKKS
jgi:DNA-directed RNA polymerase subunit N